MVGTAAARITLDPSRTGRQADKLRKDLRKRIVGQEEAIEQITKVYQTFLAGMNRPNQPIGSFLFLGPTGVGKTRVVEATAESLLGNSRGVIKVDCAEFQHSHEIAKLIGSPPGYLGHRETKSILSQQELDRYHTADSKVSLVLFDEIEKADDALWHLLLGVLDKAELTMGDNSKTDFSRTMIFMTSNLGAKEMQDMVTQGLGFAGPNQSGPKASQMARVGLSAARRRFTPEFINRLDKIVVFQRLGETQLEQLLNLELALVQERALSKVPFKFELSQAARQFLLEEGTDERYGARHLKRSIERSLVHPIVSLIATEQVRTGDLIHVDLDAEHREMIFERVGEGMPVEAMFRDAGLDFPDGYEAAAATVHDQRIPTRNVRTQSPR
jgi:ATP-dependent Clp protease ATP-binding subunit ClpA